LVLNRPVFDIKFVFGKNGPIEKISVTFGRVTFPELFECTYKFSTTFPDLSPLDAAVAAIRVQLSRSKSN
jgi:hypothetical protein